MSNTSEKKRVLRADSAVEPAAKPRTETESKLWEALRRNPGTTAAALSEAARIGRSTAPKILARWEAERLVTRTPGIADGGRRAAERWSITSREDEDQTTDDHKPAADQTTGDQADQTKGDQTMGDQAMEIGGDAEQKKRERLPQGALRGQVEDYLRDHPGDWGPNAIGKALERSTGAVANALEKLVEAGYAVRTNDRPKRYTLAPSK